MIPRKKKICKSCETEKYLFGKGLCKPCYLRLNNKPINKISQKHKELLSEYTVIRKEFLESCNYICKPNLENCTRKATEVHHMKGKVSKEVSDIPLNFGGKTVFFTMEDEVKSSIRPFVENISETVKDYFNADYTQVTNAKSLYEDFAAWRSQQFKQQVFDFIYEQGVAEGMERRDKSERNISFNNREVTTQNSNPREELEGLRHGAHKSILK